MKKILCALIVLSALSAQAALITTHTDTVSGGAVVNGVIAANEYGTGNSYAYTGGGAGFGGALGSATLYMKSDTDLLYIGFDSLGVPGDGNQVVIYFDTVAGGYSTDTNAANGMGDTTDGGRANISRLAADGIETIPYEADYAVLLNNRDGGSGGFTAAFELQGKGSTHNYFAPSNTAGLGTGNLELSLGLSDIGLSAGQGFKFSAYYISDTGFMSNEGIPDTGEASNPGFNTGNTTSFDDWHEFQTIPEPGTLAMLGLGGIALTLARWKQRRT